MQASVHAPALHAPRPARLVALAIAVHLVLCYSVIDIHFQSPVLHGIAPVQPEVVPEAMRVVLIVADGLRPDKLFLPGADGLALAPFLQHVATTAGRFGISHTRPPTESRPGHVAITAGFYEDPSALFSGWQANSVPFDSVFNRSAAAWGFGSPDVVPLWAGHGAYVWQAYDAAMEDWSANADLLALDTWVLNHTKYLLAGGVAGNASGLLEGPAILFQHFLGLDSNSHAHGGPWAAEYLENIRLVDALVAETVELLEATFPDRKTAYIFTADHGMTDQASHGDASPECTETPLVAWGAGIRLPGAPSGAAAVEGAAAAAALPGSPDGAATPQCDWRSGRGSRRCWAKGPPVWGLAAEARTDVEQAQLAPLISALLGVPGPVNSLALLPLELLGGDEESRALAACANARALLAAYDAKAERQRCMSWRLVHHPGLQAVRDPFVEQSRQEIALGQRAQRAPGARGLSRGTRHFRNAASMCGSLAREAQRALVYMQRYDWLLLSATTVAGYAAWLLFLAARLLRPAAAAAAGTPPGFRLGRWGCWAATAAALGMLGYIGAPATYFAYFAVPGLLLAQVAHDGWVLLWALRSAGSLRLASAAALTLAALVGMAAGFHRRELYAALCVAGGGAAAVATARRSSVKESNGVRCVALGLVLAAPGLFTLLPVKKDASLVLPLLACALAAVATGAAARRQSSRRPPATPCLPSERHEPSEAADSVAGTSTDVLRPTSQEALRNVDKRLDDGTSATGGHSAWAAASDAATSRVLRLQLLVLLLAALCIAATHQTRSEPHTPPTAAASGSAPPEAAGLAPRAWAAVRAGDALLCAAARPLSGLLAATAAPLRLAAGFSVLQLLAWACFVLAPLLPLAAPMRSDARTVSALLGLFTMFVLLSISWEPLFLLALDAALVALAALDADASTRRTGGAGGDDDGAVTGTGAGGGGGSQVAGGPASARGGARGAAEVDAGRVRLEGLGMDALRALVFLFCINLAFFGVGNMASVASFEPASVLRLVRKFDKLVMGLLLMTKIAIPLLSCSVVFAAATRAAATPPMTVYLLVLVFSNVMAVQFFFQVTGEGSWQTIGTSVSHFGVMNVEVVIVLLLQVVAGLYWRDLRTPKLKSA